MKAMRRWMWIVGFGVAAAGPMLAQETTASQSIQALVDAAYRAKQASVTIPGGIYHVAAAGGAHLRFAEMENFTIDARGVTLLLEDPTRTGVVFEHCRNVTLRGGTLGYAISPSTQGVVAAIAADGMTYDVKIDKGWPTNLDDARYFKADPIAYLFDRETRWWKQGATDLYGDGKPERLGPDTFRVRWKRALGPDVHNVAVGDLIAFRGAGRQMVQVDDSARMNMDGVTVLNAAGMAFRESGGDGDNRYSVTVKRGPRMGEETTDPLLSSTADGFHSVNVRKGPTVDNSYFEAMTDDGIAIHGHYSLVLSAAGDKLVVNRSDFRSGDLLQLCDAEGKPAGDAKVIAVEPMAKFINTRKSSRNTRQDVTGGPYTQLTLDRILKADFDYLVENASANGNGFTVRNNTIYNHRARGILIKAQDGIIEHNTIDGSTMSGILLAPEFWWNESGYVRNIVVRDNTIRHVSYAPHAFGGVVLFALSEDAALKGTGQHPLDGFGNQNITFEGNRLEGIDGVNLVVTSAKGVVIRGNTFKNPDVTPVTGGGVKWGAEGGALIFVAKSTGVVLEGNTVTGRGKGNKMLVKLGDGAEVKGAETGITLLK